MRGPVVERLDVGESLGVGMASIAEDVKPAASIAGAGVALVEYVKVDEAMGVERATVPIDMTAQTVIGKADNGGAFAVVARVEMAADPDAPTIGVDMAVQAVASANRTAALLKVAAPVVAFRVERGAVHADVQPTSARFFDRRETVVEAPRLTKACRVDGQTVGINVERAGSVLRRSDARLVILADKAKARFVQGRTTDNVMRAIGGDLGKPPRVYLPFRGFRMLHVWHS